MSWIYEHGEQYEVPRVIREAEGIEDLSWHNDTCPSFGRYVEGASGDSHDLRIWVEHPDPDQREAMEGRFAVTYSSWSEPAAEGLAEFNDGEALYEGDDPAEALACFMVALAKVYAALRGAA